MIAGSLQGGLGKEDGEEEEEREDKGRGEEEEKGKGKEDVVVGVMNHLVRWCARGQIAAVGVHSIQLPQGS